MFGKLMSISDTLMWKYFELLSFRSMDDIAQLQKQVKEGLTPRDTNVSLAQEIVARFHSQQAARAALASFDARCRDRLIPDDLQDVLFGAVLFELMQVFRVAGLVSA